jgi:tol-pal system protein YbgF
MGAINLLRAIISVVSAAFLLGGCATSDMDNLRNDIRNLQIESLGQRKDINNMKADISSIKENSLGSVRESQSSILNQTSDLSREVQILKGRFDENKYYADKSIKELLTERELQNAKIASLENEMKELKNKLIAPADKKEQPPVQDKAGNKETPDSAAKPSDKPADTTDAQQLYDNGQIDFKEKKYAAARQKFEKFIKDNSQHQLVPNAQFLIGEAYYAEKKFEDAILAYESVLKKYSSHEKARAAMLKQGYAFIELGDKKTGKVILEKLIEKYPRSKEAELAEKKIAEILEKKSSPSKTDAKKKKSTTAKKKASN